MAEGRARRAARIGTVAWLVCVVAGVVAALPVAGQDEYPLVVPEPPTAAERAVVVDVTDGDTILVRLDDGREERLRYIGIDTPEIAQPGRAAEPWGPEAAAANERLVAGQVVLLERDVSERDPYDRLLRYVWLESPAGWLLVNDELVALGLAEVRAYEPDTKYHAWMLQTQARAEREGAGRFSFGSDARVGTTAELRALSFIEAYNARDARVLRGLLGRDVRYDPPGPASYEGREPVLEALRGEWAISEARLDLRGIFAEEGSVAMEMTILAVDEATDAAGILLWEGDRLTSYRLYLDAPSADG